MQFCKQQATRMIYVIYTKLNMILIISLQSINYWTTSRNRWTCDLELWL